MDPLDVLERVERLSDIQARVLDRMLGIPSQNIIISSGNGGHSRNKLSDEKIQRIIELRKQGLSRGEIAEQVGCSTRSVSRYTDKVSEPREEINYVSVEASDEDVQNIIS